MLQAFDLLVEYKKNPIGMDEVCPRFFYLPQGDSRKQTARQIRVTGEDGDVVWDSGWIKSSVSIQIPYEGQALRRLTRYDWQVRLQDENGAEGPWSETAFFESGFLGGAWSPETKWIDANGFGYVANLRREFAVKGKIVKARLYATALGLYEACLNGKKVSEDCLMPGWTDYFHRVQYQAYDVTGLLTDGENVLAFLVGDGWFKGRIASHLYGDDAMLLAELRITYADGTEQVIGTNRAFQKLNVGFDGYDRWHYSDFYDGEYFIAGPKGCSWMFPGFDLSKVRHFPAREMNPERPPQVVWNSGAPVRRMMERKPTAITHRQNGNWIVDFGQNFAGREKLTLKNVQAGTTILIQHGEMLQENGSLYTDNLRTARTMTIYRCQYDKPEESYEPKFTTYGFRYLEISGFPGELTPENISAYVLYSDLKNTGMFSCSEPLVNQLFSNIVWGQRSNFIDIPTDCPQRDERYGWTGDAQIFANMATYNMFSAEFYTKWITDLNLCQNELGEYPAFAPAPSPAFMGATGWSDAGVVCPWVMYNKYGDVRIVEKYMKNILRWLDYEVKRNHGSYILTDRSFLDWLNLDAPTSERWIPTAYLAGMNLLAAKMAKGIGDDGLACERMMIHKKIAEAFGKEFFTPDGELKEKTQTAALLALEFQCVPEQFIEKTVDFLVKDIRDTHQVHLTTGFLGTPLLLKVLTAHGHSDLAYDLLLQTTYPGWLYPVTQGATTMWERWNSWTQENGFGPVNMNSFNHYGYGAAGDWFFETIGGIQPATEDAASAGFQKFRLAPQPGQRLTNASARYDSICGTIRSEWKRNGSEFIWKFTIPCNTMAEIVCPFGLDLPETDGICRTRDGRRIAEPGSYEIKLSL